MGGKPPAQEFTLGRIRAAVWANTTEDQNVWFTITIGRLYKTDGEWKENSSFSRDDLPIVNKALDMAYGWILRRERKLKLEQKASGTKVQR